MLEAIRKLFGKILGIVDTEAYYVGSGETLPVPLTPAEESRALGEMRAGSAAAKARKAHLRSFQSRAGNMNTNPASCIHRKNAQAKSEKRCRRTNCSITFAVKAFHINRTAIRAAKSVHMVFFTEVMAVFPLSLVFLRAILA